MKRSPRFSRTVKFLKAHPKAVEFFGGRWVYVYSGEYQMFWRAEAAGHTSDLAKAGRYPFSEMWPWLSEVGKEKKLSVQIISDVDQRTLAHHYSKHMKNEVKETSFDNRCT